MLKKLLADGLSLCIEILLWDFGYENRIFYKGSDLNVFWGCRVLIMADSCERMGRNNYSIK